MTKKFNLKDFIKPIISDKPVKMALSLFDGKETIDTGQTLSVISGKSKKVEVDYFTWAAELKSADEALVNEEDPIKRSIDHRNGKLKADAKLCKAVITGWSFEEKFTKKAVDEMLRDNHELAAQIIEHCFEIGAYIEKK